MRFVLAIFLPWIKRIDTTICCHTFEMIFFWFHKMNLLICPNFLIKMLFFWSNDVDVSRIVCWFVSKVRFPLIYCHVFRYLFFLSIYKVSRLSHIVLSWISCFKCNAKCVSIFLINDLLNQIEGFIINVFMIISYRRR